MSVSIYRQRKAYARTKGICVICGKPISRDESAWSVDHFIPRAIYKWVPGIRIQRLIESGDNIFIVHPRCNYKKDSALPTNRLIKSMHADDEILDSMRALYKEAEEGVVAYRAIKQSTLDSQGRRCAICGRRISLNDSTMRRINNRRGRTKDNAMCLCNRCNAKAGSSWQKKRMVKRASKKPVSRGNKTS